jgi:hypothetical protein
MRVVLDYLNLVFWWTVLMLVKGMIRTILFFTPISYKKKIITQNKESKVKVTFNKDEVGKYDKNKYTCELVIHDNRFYHRVFDTSLGIGESYAVRDLIKISLKR